MKNRDFNFRAFIIVGDKEEVKAMVPDVAIYDSGNAGCGIEAFTEALESTGYSFDGDYFESEGKEDIEAGEFNVYNGDDWVFFDGIIMQNTGLKDKSGTPIYEGDIIRSYDSKNKEILHYISYS